MSSGVRIKKRLVWEKNQLRNPCLQRQRTSKLDSPKGDFNWAAILLYSRPNRQYSLLRGGGGCTCTGYKITLRDIESLACVASVSNRAIARKSEREQKKMEGEEGEKRKRLPANPTILENAPWYFTVRFICKLTARQNRNITNRLPLDYQICKITLFSNRTRCRRLQEL